MENPYSTPQSNLNRAPIANDALQAIPRISTWIIVGATILTFGIYLAYWAYSRAKRLNEAAEGRYGIDPTYLTTSIALYVVSLGLSVISEFNRELLNLALVSSLLSLIANLLLLVLAFKFRNRINSYLQDCGRGQLRAGPVATFFFTFMYMQYKINQIKDQQAAESEIASATMSG